MFTSNEKDLIERCFAISIWNHRAGRSAVAGKLIEATAFRERVRYELRVLEKMMLKKDAASIRDSRPGNRMVEFFGKLMRARGQE